jgi:uncharacterized membrane protein/mono/diheme cytochrome c family protein
MFEFIGRFHPLLVHLPIGILLLAGVFQLLSRKSKFNFLKPVLPMLFFWGMISAILSCITGFLLSQGDGYDEQLINRHQWMGIGVATISILAHAIQKKRILLNSQWLVSCLLLILLIITGHLGGSLTHGSDYLSFATVANESKSAVQASAPKPIDNVQESVAYTDVIQPILQNNCYSCHGPNKQKGGLRMDDMNLFLKGGKHGEVFMAGKAIESEMIKRVQLPDEFEHHMPPKGKPQPTEKEIALLHWWISSGASFDKKVSQLEQPEKIKPLLLALQNPVASYIQKIDDIVPGNPVPEADENILKKLKDAGIVILPVAKNSNYLSASFVTVPAIKDEHFKLLTSLKEQLIELKLGSTNLTNADLRQIVTCVALRKLLINNTAISDSGLVALKTLTHLKYLNLVGTKITANGVKSLKDLKELTAIYLYKTGINKTDWPTLKQVFPKTLLDSGGYVVEYLPSDTVILKKAIERK